MENGIKLSLVVELRSPITSNPTTSIVQVYSFFIYEYMAINLANKLRDNFWIFLYAHSFVFSTPTPIIGLRQFIKARHIETMFVTAKVPNVGSLNIQAPGSVSGHLNHLPYRLTRLYPGIGRRFSYWLIFDTSFYAGTAEGRVIYCSGTRGTAVVVNSGGRHRFSTWVSRFKALQADILSNQKKVEDTSEILFRLISRVGLILEVLTDARLTMIH